MTTPDSVLVVGLNVTDVNPMQDGTSATTVEKIKSGEQRNYSSTCMRNYKADTRLLDRSTNNASNN